MPRRARSSFSITTQPIWPQQKLTSGLVRIGLLVGMLMMPAVNRDPARRRVLHAANAEHGKNPRSSHFGQRVRDGEEAMIAKIDPEHAEDVEPGIARLNVQPAIFRKSCRPPAGRLPLPASVARRGINWLYAVGVGGYHLLALLAFVP